MGFFKPSFYFLANAEQFHALIWQIKLNTLERYKDIHLSITFNNDTGKEPNVQS